MRIQKYICKTFTNKSRDFLQNLARLHYIHAVQTNEQCTVDSVLYLLSAIMNSYYQPIDTQKAHIGSNFVDF